MSRVSLLRKGESPNPSLGRHAGQCPKSNSGSHALSLGRVTGRVDEFQKKTLDSTKFMHDTAKMSPPWVLRI